MSDVFDRASEVEDAHRARSEADVRGRIQSGDWREISAKWCQEPTCGMRIPDARRRAVPGVELCTECAERAERMMRGMRK